VTCTRLARLLLALLVVPHFWLAACGSGQASSAFDTFRCPPGGELASIREAQSGQVVQRSEGGVTETKTSTYKIYQVDNEWLACRFVKCIDGSRPRITTSSFECVRDCPPSFILDGDACICPPGHTVVDQVCRCVPPLVLYSDTSCRPPACTRGNERWNGSLCVCGPGLIRDANEDCVYPACSNTRHVRDSAGRCTCPQCGGGKQVVDQSTCGCVCPRDQVEDTAGRCTWLPCPNPRHERRSTGACECPPCARGKRLADSQQCTCTCPPQQVEDGTGVCEWLPCPREGHVRDSNGRCGPPPCPDGQVRSRTGECVCPGNKILSGAGLCDCPQGMEDRGDRCRCPQGERESAGRCVCTEGKVRVGGICDCPRGTFENEDGTCVRDRDNDDRPPDRPAAACCNAMTGQAVCGMSFAMPRGVQCTCLQFPGFVGVTCG
jgi:hypothetical protein